MTTKQRIKVIAPYKPLKWHTAPLYDQSLVILLTGGAGGGKSRCASEKLHAYLMRYAGATGLMLRKAQEFASKSIVPFMYHTVIGGAESGIEMNKSGRYFKYPNGSTLYWGGMKDDSQRESLRSIGADGSLDIVWMEEANAFSEKDFEEILGRMRGKASSWRQVILTTNPDSPNHWINKRLILGKEANVYYSKAQDNPYNPPDYQATLNRMTGIMKLRMVEGLWVQAEGVVYDNFSPEVNVTEEAEYNPHLPIIWGVDDGYALGGGTGTIGYHPRVILFGQETAQGGINIFDEYYAVQELEEVSIENALAKGYPLPMRAFVDSSASQLKARIALKQIQAQGATHVVTEGIKNVRRMLGNGDGVSLLRIHPRCTELIREMQSYAYDRNSNVAVVGEQKPAKVDDHGPDALRYMTYHLRYITNYD